MCVPWMQETAGSMFMIQPDADQRPVLARSAEATRELAHNCLARQHPSQWAASEQVDVKVWHFLSRMLAHVGKQAVARRFQS
jgi:hypothetical protein